MHQLLLISHENCDQNRKMQFWIGYTKGAPGHHAVVVDDLYIQTQKQPMKCSSNDCKTSGCTQS